ncbi:Apoptosis-inducing factor [Penicillium taxi]|uniref:Apoptosis-inducing factor n=1 Tax=Penicillium taxi TaxID=168475 RepID=UPI002545704D|nr:Apoptosis-inducing factor [Penicillium taxi]KAJ5901649.1 Apoptosis-inducing factor [Penicillium taxi]
MAPTVLIIGASVTGLTAAHALLRDVPNAKIVLVNPSSYFYWMIAAPRIVAKASAFKSDQYLIPIKEAFSQYPAESFEFILGAATAIDPSTKTVTITSSGSEQSVTYDHLLIASGSTTPATIGELSGLSIPFKNSNRDDMKELIEAAQQKIKSVKNIVIGGAGPIGVEVAGELAEAVAANGQEVDITLVSSADRVLPMLKPSAGSTAEKQLKQKKVKIITSTRVLGAETSGENSWTVTLDNGKTLSTELYIPTTGDVPNNSFIPKQFLDADGWVKIDKELRVVGDSLPIYAAGDIGNNSMRLSLKAVEQAKIAANNIKVDILGKGARKSYDQGDSIMMMVPVGSTGGSGQIFGFVPFNFLVKMAKGGDYFVSKAAATVAGKS